MTYTRDAACRLEGLVKKCASCSKDLPDAALHCVFCGAKQAPAPAQAGLQKTVMGYSAQEMLAQMKAQGVPPGTPGAAPSPALFPAPAAAMPPAIGSSAPTMFDPNARPMNPPMNQPPQAGPRGSVDATLPPQGFNPNAGALNLGAPGAGPKGSIDATLPPQGFPQGFNAATEARAQAQAMGMSPPRGNVEAPMAPAGFHAGAPHASGPAPIGSTPLSAPVFGPSSGPIPAYAGGPAAMMPMPGGTYNPALVRGGEDPLSNLRTLSLVFGILIVITFLLPVRLDPLQFAFSNIGSLFDAGITVILGVLLLPAVGLLAIVFGVVPMGTAPRGAACAVIGLAPFVMTFALGDHTSWQDVADTFGMIFLLAGLVIRGGYHGSMLARILVTIGALAFLAPQLVPVGGGGVPIVGALQALGDAPTSALIAAVMGLAQLLLALAALLAWLPRTSSGGANVFFWTLLALTALTPFVPAVIEMGGELVKSPALALSWTSFLAMYGLASYGLGALLGKITE